MKCHNPKLSYEQRVRLKDGREGTIADKADHQKSRQVSVDGEPVMQKVKVTEIVACETSILGWLPCTWD